MLENHYEDFVSEEDSEETKKRIDSFKEKVEQGTAGTLDVISIVPFLMDKIRVRLEYLADHGYEVIDNLKSILNSKDWRSLLNEFKEKYGKELSHETNEFIDKFVALKLEEGDNEN